VSAVREEWEHKRDKYLKKRCIDLKPSQGYSAYYNTDPSGVDVSCDGARERLYERNDTKKEVEGGNQYVVGEKTEKITSVLALVKKKVQPSVIIREVDTCTERLGAG